MGGQGLEARDAHTRDNRQTVLFITMSAYLVGLDTTRARCKHSVSEWVDAEWAGRKPGRATRNQDAEQDEITHIGRATRTAQGEPRRHRNW